MREENRTSVAQLDGDGNRNHHRQQDYQEDERRSEIQRTAKIDRPVFAFA
jgi:hypothetical protein